jgi:uncharacterized protein (TIGR00299 family) protein
MRIAYFDCFSGISGDMTIAAFLDAGMEFGVLKRELSKLKISGYELKSRKVKRGGFACTAFECRTGHDHSHRTLSSILSIIDKSALNRKVKAISANIFRNIAKAEAAVHGIGRQNDVILHELGAVDSIVDIVGAAIAIDELGIDEVHSSAVSMGRTSVNCAHGKIPAPSPASLELLKGIPVRIAEVEAELVTPTGAGILKTVAKSFGAMPQGIVSSLGCGAGSRELSGLPNMLRIIIAERSASFNEDSVFVIETNIDDMNPQTFDYLMERLFKEGALDAYITPVQMKKSRPAFKLTVLSSPQLINRLASIIFRETTTTGLRFHEAGRLMLDRKFVDIRTRFGPVKVKVGIGPDGIRTTSPEYDECAKIARARKVPLKTVYDEAKRLVNA